MIDSVSSPNHEIMQLKARVYDILAMREQIEMEMQSLNNRIRELLNATSKQEVVAGDSVA